MSERLRVITNEKRMEFKENGITKQVEVDALQTHAVKYHKDIYVYKRTNLRTVNDFQLRHAYM